MASSPNSQEAHNSASNKEMTPDREGSKSPLKRLKVAQPLPSWQEKKDAEKAEEFVEPAEVNAPGTETLAAEESKYETARDEESKFNTAL